MTIYENDDDDLLHFINDLFCLPQCALHCKLFYQKIQHQHLDNSYISDFGNVLIFS